MGELPPRLLRTAVAVPPASYEFNLPLPPSVNRRIKYMGNQSPSVMSWIRRADAHLTVSGQLRSRPRVDGKFALVITWASDTPRRGDIDNRLKPLLDYLTRIEVIADDRWCERLEVSYGRAPEGCRVVLTAIVP
jgi:Holliday junction resolvase RusA-like endonuclease